MHRFVIMLILPIIFLAGWTKTGAAATVVLQNGDRLSGEIVKLQEGILHLKTDYAEAPLHLPWPDIAAIDSEEPVTVRLQTGDMLKGQLRMAESTERLTVETEHFTAQEIDRSQLAAINPPGRKPVRLRGSFSLGGVYETGNTERTGLNLAIDATRKDRRHRFGFGLNYNYAEEDGELSDRNVFGRLQYDYFFTEKLYGYLATELFSDEFKDLKLRTQVGPGVGYQVWDQERKSLAFEAGVAYYNEDLEEGEDDSWITARLAMLFRYAFQSGLEFKESLTIYPSLESLSNYTLRNEAALTAPMAFGWSLQLKNIIDYDSEPDAEAVKKTDYYWTLGLNYAF